MDQQAYTGGFNGITDLSHLKVGNLEFDAYGPSAYYLIVSVMTIVLFLTLIITKSRAGLIFQAIRDDENRVRFLGYNVGVYKTASLCISAGIGGVAGMLYTIVMEFASPTFMSISAKFISSDLVCCWWKTKHFWFIYRSIDHHIRPRFLYQSRKPFYILGL